MLKIAICDDQPFELSKLQAMVEKYAGTCGTDAEIRGFKHPDPLLDACDKESFHIYILDIVMPMIDGIALGREIRRHDKEAQILYVTTEPEFALGAYAVNPIDFLIKPLKEQRLFEALDLAVSKLSLSAEQVMTVKTVNGLRVLRIASICYCEYSSHSVRYVLKGGETVTTRTIAGKFSDHIAPLLNDRRFISPHVSFAVNMNEVERFNKDSFVLFSKAVIPIAAKQYPGVRDTYMDYLMSRKVNK